MLGSLLIIAPWLNLLISGLFFWLWRSGRGALLLTTALLWLVYGVYESLMYLRILCSGECNIRIDLLLIYPLLALVSLAALVAYYLKLRKQQGT